MCCPQPVQRCAAHSKWCSGQRKGLGWCYSCNKDIWYFLHIFTCELLIIHHQLTFLMWGGTESLNKTFRKQNTWFLGTQLHSCQGYVSKTLWNPTSEQTVSVVTSTLLKISNSWGGPQPSQFQQLLSACSGIAPLEWTGHISVASHLTWVSFASRVVHPKPKDTLITSRLLTVHSAVYGGWAVSQWCYPESKNTERYFHSPKWRTCNACSRIYHDSVQKWGHKDHLPGLQKMEKNKTVLQK